MKYRSHHLRLAALLVVVASLTACHLLGDPIFAATGQVVECESRNPIPEVTIDLLDDRGDGAVVDLMDSSTTDAQGRFHTESGRYGIGTPLTLRFSKTGFQTKEVRVDGGGDQPGEVCLMAAPAP